MKKQTQVAVIGRDGNHISKLNRMIEAKELNGLQWADIRHDLWCRIWNGRDCNCDPEIVTVGLPELLGI